MPLNSVQAKNIFLLYETTRVTHRNTLLNDYSESVFHFTNLFSLSILLHFLVCSICDIIHKTEETIRMQTLALFASLFYHFSGFKKFKK